VLRLTGTIQFYRYALIGLLTNFGGYLIYLLITWLGVGPKSAMSGLYVVGAVLSFIGNRQWTFSHRGSVVSSFARFLIAHLLGYGLNLSLLLVFVDRLGYPHQWVQGAAIFVVAFFLFTSFRLYVFRNMDES